MPVRGKTLNAGEGVSHQSLHRARRHIDERPSDERAQRMKGDHQTDEMSQRAQGGGRIAAARRQRIDKRARGQRNKNIDEIRGDPRHDHETEKARRQQPVARREAKGVSIGVKGHGETARSDRDEARRERRDGCYRKMTEQSLEKYLFATDAPAIACREATISASPARCFRERPHI